MPIVCLLIFGVFVSLLHRNPEISKEYNFLLILHFVSCLLSLVSWININPGQSCGRSCGQSCGHHVDNHVDIMWTIMRTIMCHYCRTVQLLSQRILYKFRKPFWCNFGCILPFMQRLSCLDKGWVLADFSTGIFELP